MKHDINMVSVLYKVVSIGEWVSMVIQCGYSLQAIVRELNVLYF